MKFLMSSAEPQSIFRSFQIYFQPPPRIPNFFEGPPKKEDLLGKRNAHVEG